MGRMILSMGYKPGCFISQGKGERIRDLGLRRRITQHMVFGNILVFYSLSRALSVPR